MNINKIKVGDIVEFISGKDGKTILHGKVNAKGRKFLLRTMPYNGDVVFINVFEHPEWKDVTIFASQVIDIFILPEKVEFT